MEQRYTDIVGSMLDIKAAMSDFRSQIESLSLECPKDELIDQPIDSKID